MKTEVLAVLLSTLASVYCQYKETCAPNALRFNDLCYQLHKPDHFEGALEWCGYQRNSKLVSIHSKQENDFVAGFAEELLIGFHYVNDSYVWQDGSIVNYTNVDENFYHWKDYFGYCTKMVSGLWENADCELDTLPYVCKSGLLSFPDTPRDQCGNTTAITMCDNHGYLYSPGFPEYYDANHELHCEYRIIGKVGSEVSVTFRTVELLSREDVIKIYRGWTADDEHLIGNVTTADIGRYPSFIAQDSNRMLIQFEGITEGLWEMWYDC